MEAVGQTTLFQKATAIWKADDFGDAYYRFEVGVATSVARHFELNAAMEVEDVTRLRVRTGSYFGQDRAGGNGEGGEHRSILRRTRRRAATRLRWKTKGGRRSAPLRYDRTTRR